MNRRILETIARREGVRILYAEYVEHELHFIFVRDLSAYIKVFPKNDVIVAEANDTFVLGKDLRLYFKEVLDHINRGWFSGEEIVIQTPIWSFIQSQIGENEQVEISEVDALFYQIITGKVDFEVINTRSRMADYIYEKVPEAEIELLNQFGEKLYLYAYKATAYEAYGLMDISFLDHDFDEEEIDQEAHTLEAFDSFTDALASPYAALYLEAQDLMYSAMTESMADDDEDGGTGEFNELLYMANLYTYGAE